MEVNTAKAISDAQARCVTPRSDYSSDEGRRYAFRMRPYLAPWIQPGSLALDLGCSFGKSAFLLAELGARVVGIDVSLGALRFARGLQRKLSADVEVVCADYARLPFRSRAFAIALFPHNVLECSPEEFSLVVAETARVLSRDGLLLLSLAKKWADPNQDSPVLRPTNLTIGSEGVFSYPIYSWSSAAVIARASPCFSLVQTQDMPERSGTWHVFRVALDTLRSSDSIRPFRSSSALGLPLAAEC